MLKRDDGQEVRVKSIMLHVRGAIIPAQMKRATKGSPLTKGSIATTFAWGRTGRKKLAFEY